MFALWKKKKEKKEKQLQDSTPAFIWLALKQIIHVTQPSAKNWSWRRKWMFLLLCLAWRHTKAIRALISFPFDELKQEMVSRSLGALRENQTKPEQACELWAKTTAEGAGLRYSLLWGDVPKILGVRKTCERARRNRTRPRVTYKDNQSLFGPSIEPSWQVQVCISGTAAVPRTVWWPGASPTAVRAFHWERGSSCFPWFPGNQHPLIALGTRVSGAKRLELKRIDEVEEHSGCNNAPPARNTSSWTRERISQTPGILWRGS